MLPFLSVESTHVHNNTRKLFGPLVNWGLYGVLCVQTCKDIISSPAFSLINLCTDVYSYNFPDDQRFIKVLGECSRSVGGPDDVTTK
jgi:hypothetical protein